MITHPLKVLSLIATFAGIQGAAPVRAAVNMISAKHRVWGWAGQPGPEQNTYDETGPAPLSRSVSSGDLMSDHYYASSSASDWSVNAYAVNGAPFGYNAYAQAQNSYVFQPLSRELSISLNGVIGVWWFENGAKMTLTDLNTNSLVSIYESAGFSGISPFTPFENDMVDYPFNWGTTVELNPEHQYELIILAFATREEGGDGSASLNLTLIPEPGVSLLTGITVLLMWGRRRRQA